MKSIIVLSDTHGSDGSMIRSDFAGKTYLLNGNCDVPRLGEDTLTLEIEGVKIFACHGDRLGVKRGTAELARRAAEEGADIALFGHTHRAVEEQKDGVTLFNPGTRATCTLRCTTKNLRER